MDNKNSKNQQPRGGQASYGNSIARKIIIAIIVFSSIITLITTAVQLVFDYKRDVALIDTNIEQIRIGHLPSLVNSVWNFDDQQIEHQLNGLQRIPDIEFLGVMIEGQAQWSAGKQVSKYSVSTSLPLLHTYRGKEVNVGELRIIASLDSVFSRLARKALVILLSNAIKTFLVAGFMFFIFRYLVTRHLETLANFMRNLDFRKPLRTLKLDRKSRGGRVEDELDQLTSAINEMTEYSHDSYHKLQSTHDELETVVEERTHQLKEKNLELTTLANQLSKYLSPQVYSSIFTGQQEVKLDSRRKKLTVLFSDIVGFTSASDRMEAEDMTFILNCYFTEMTRVALQYGGTIDKYIGDTIMLFFGDPDSNGVREDAIACVRAAVEMRGKLAAIQEEWRKEGINLPIKTRTGIHTGYCTVGNFGSNERMDYTIVGGTVNLASRLETIAEPGTILISGDTQVLVEDVISCLPKGEINITGLAYPVSTFEVEDTNT